MHAECSSWIFCMNSFRYDVSSVTATKSNLRDLTRFNNPTLIRFGKRNFGHRLSDKDEAQVSKEIHFKNIICRENQTSSVFQFLDVWEDEEPSGVKCFSWKLAPRLETEFQSGRRRWNGQILYEFLKKYFLFISFISSTRCRPAYWCGGLDLTPIVLIFPLSCTVIDHTSHWRLLCLNLLCIS